MTADDGVFTVPGRQWASSRHLYARTGRLRTLDSTLFCCSWSSAPPVLRCQFSSLSHTSVLVDVCFRSLPRIPFPRLCPRSCLRPCPYLRTPYLHLRDVYCVPFHARPSNVSPPCTYGNTPQLYSPPPKPLSTLSQYATYNLLAPYTLADIRSGRTLKY
jgi:hypothetical protein